METAHRVPAEKRLRQRLRRQIGWGRTALLVILGVTLLNQFLLMFHVDYHFLFSAAVPYYLNWLVQELRATSDVGAFGALAVVLTVLLYGAYIVCWLQSSHRKEWLVASLGLYGLDTLLLIIFCLTLLENPASCLLEILTHSVGIVLLVLAVRAAEQLSRMPRQRRVPEQLQAQESAEGASEI
jgi:hypothetical protein